MVDERIKAFLISKDSNPESYGIGRKIGLTILAAIFPILAIIFYSTGVNVWGKIISVTDLVISIIFLALDIACFIFCVIADRQKYYYFFHGVTLFLFVGYAFFASYRLAVISLPEWCIIIPFLVWAVSSVLSVLAINEGIKNNCYQGENEGEPKAETDYTENTRVKQIGKAYIVYVILHFVFLILFLIFNFIYPQIIEGFKKSNGTLRVIIGVLIGCIGIEISAAWQFILKHIYLMKYWDDLVAEEEENSSDHTEEANP